MSALRPADFSNGYYEKLPSITGDEPEGEVYRRHNYQFLDLSFSHRLLTRGAHSLAVALGPSYAWGKNVEIISYNYNPDYEWNCEGPILSDMLNAHYWGGVGGLSYDYRFSKHFSAGAFGNARVYNGLHTQLEVGLNVSYHFRAFKSSAKAND